MWGGFRYLYQRFYFKMGQVEYQNLAGDWREVYTLVAYKSNIIFIDICDILPALVSLTIIESVLLCCNLCRTKFTSVNYSSVVWSNIFFLVLLVIRVKYYWKKINLRILLHFRHFEYFQPPWTNCPVSRNRY